MDFTTIITILVVIVAFIVLFKIFKLLMRLLLVAVFLFLAYLTNPGQQQHAEAAQKKAGAGGVNMIGKKIEADNYYVFSLTKSIRAGDSKVIGAGAFTRVFVFRNP